ncbi:MAG: orotidine-5'-phosphate decarboxylase [Proteobacteria bacterium]|nr:orotidine-5'-phosphate decarboxylase [Pseudomonadota bacterium]
MSPAGADPAAKILVALDTPDLASAEAQARALSGLVGGVKLGLEFFAAQGPQGVARVIETGQPVFLDLKFHDIPATVAGAVRAAARLGAFMLTVHAGGGRAMLRAAVEAAAEGALAAGMPRPLIVAVSVLTSLSESDLASLGVAGGAEAQALRLARLARAAGADGAVASPREVAALRAALGPGFALVVPGIRPAGEGADDQKRVAGPAEAIAAGADFLVVGRPITRAPDPAAAARAVAAEIARGAPA